MMPTFVQSFKRATHRCLTPSDSPERQKLWHIFGGWRCQVGLATFVFLVPEAVLGSESAAPAPKYASFSGENNDKALDGMRYGTLFSNKVLKLGN